MLLKHCCAATVAASLIVFAGQVRAQDAHGAIVVGQTADGDSIAYGFAWNYGMKDEATAAALNACLGSGGTNCAELARFRNGCGALALDQFGHAGGTGAMSQEQAEAGALRRCEAAGGSGCAVVGSQCAHPGGQAGTWSGSERILAPPDTDAAEHEAEQPTQAGEMQEEALTREQRIRVQKGLAALGFDAGPADGIFGPKTRAAIWDWQAAKELETTGYLTLIEAEALAAIGAETSETLDMEVEATAMREPGDTEAETATVPSKSRSEVLYFPTCGTDDARPDGCWLALSSPTDCVLWWDRGAPRPSETVSWSGACDDTLRASGRGMLKWRDWSESGELLEGKKHDQWAERSAGGQVREGPYVDGTRQGRWIWRFSGGDVWEGPYVNGKRNGRAVIRLTDGGVWEGPYVDDEMHGRWIFQHADGDVWEGPFVDGRRHGRWVIRWAHGDVWEGPYVNDDRHGRWIYRHADGTTEVNEYHHGDSVP